MAGLLRAIFGYFFLVFIVRVVGRRPGKFMNPFEFVLIFFIGGLALTAIVGDEHSISSAFIQIFAMGLSHLLLVLLRQRSPWLGRLLDGTPLLLISGGRWHEETMRQMLIERDDVLTAVRDKGLASIEDVEYATLERSGEITIAALR